MGDYRRATYDTVWAILIKKEPTHRPRPTQRPIDTRTPSGKPLPY